MLDFTEWLMSTNEKLVSKHLTNQRDQASGGVRVLRHRTVTGMKTKSKIFLLIETKRCLVHSISDAVKHRLKNETRPKRCNGDKNCKDVVK